MATPDRGDLVYVDFNPQSGHEQAGRRPAICLSPKAFNDVTGFASLCPITQTKRGWGYEVELPAGLAFSGVVLTHQVKNLDWRARGPVQVYGTAPQSVVDDCLAKIHTFLA